MRLRFLPNTATWSTALALACALPSCSSDSKSDTARATETDDNSSADDDSPSDTPEAGTSEGDDDGAADDEPNDSSNTPDDDRTDDPNDNPPNESEDDTPNGADDDSDSTQPDDPAGDGSSTDDADDSSDSDDGIATSDDVGAETVCTQGDTRECVGVGACSGGQICGADGFWGACECGGAPDEAEPAQDEEVDGSTGGESPDVGGAPDEVLVDDASQDDGQTSEAVLGQVSDDLPAPPGVNMVPLLPEGVVLTEPLVVSEWGIDERVSGWNESQALGLRFRFGVLASQFGGSSSFLDFEREDVGRYCLSGLSSYRDGAMGFVLHELTNEAEEVNWAPAEKGVLGVVFDLENVPFSGVVCAVTSEQSSSNYRRCTDGRWAFLFADHTAVPYIENPSDLPVFGFPEGRVETLVVAAHYDYPDTDTLYAEHDFCLSNVRFIRRGE